MIKKYISFLMIVLSFCIPASIGYAESDNEHEISLDGQILKKDQDYRLTYYDNKEVGTAKVVVEFIGNYTGTRECRFNILPKERKSSGGGGGGSSSTKSAIPTTTPTPLLPSESVQTEKPIQTPLADTHSAYISGYEDGTFQPDSKITRAETAAMLDRVIYVDVTVSMTNFSDLKSGAWYIPFINNMNAAGFIHGYEDGTFRPDNNITRAEFVTMLMQNREIRKYQECPFTDLSSDLWSADYIYSAYMEGLIDGYEDETFRPDNYITRAEAVAVVNRMAGRSADRDYVNNHITELNRFTDMKDSVYWAFYDVIEAANSHSIVNGADGERWVK